MEAEILPVSPDEPSIEDVNRHLLKKIDDLIESVDAKTDPELVKVLTESVAKLNTSLKGNDIFTPKETDADRLERETTEALSAAMKG